MKKLGLLTAVAVTLIAATTFAESITSIGAAYMARANTVGADFDLKEKLETTTRFASGSGPVKIELLRAQIRVQSKTEANGEWLPKLFLSVNDNINNYYFNLTDRKIVALKSIKPNDKATNVLDITVEVENSVEVEYQVTLLPTPREDNGTMSKVFHIIRLTDRSPVPTAAASLSGSVTAASAGVSRDVVGRTSAELPRTLKKP